MLLDYREKVLFKYWPTCYIVTLEVGDIIEAGFCIERKGGPDFLKSILNHHIFNQAQNMYANYPGKCVIIVEGDLKSLPQTAFFGKIDMTIDAIRAAIASLYTKYHVPVLLASNRTGFVEMVNKLLEKYKESGDCTLEVYTPSEVSKKKSNPKLQVLLQVPKIGIKKAKKILDWYGEFHNIGILEKPPGVSDKDLENILEVLK